MDNRSSWYFVKGDSVSKAVSEQDDTRLRGESESRLLSDALRLETLQYRVRIVLALVWPVFIVFMMVCIGYGTFRWAFR